MGYFDLNGYFCGGYFLIRVKNPEYLQAGSDLLPNKVFSLSTCIVTKLNIVWGWTTGDPQAALDFGIPQHKLDDFIAWCTLPQVTKLCPSVFITPQDARTFIQQFDLDTTDLYIIGAGLPKEFEEANWQEEPDDENHLTGIELTVEKHVSLENGGTILGHEVVGFSHGVFDCSWLCNGIQKDAKQEFGIEPNRYGLITEYIDAKKVYDWIMVDQSSRAEANIGYDVWLLVSYPLE